MARVLKMKNTSQLVVPVETTGVVVYLRPGNEISDVDIDNLDEIRQFVTAVEDLQEVGKKTSGKKKSILVDSI